MAKTARFPVVVVVVVGLISLAMLFPLERARMGG